LDKIRYERELYQPLRQYLANCGFEVRSEVNTCDLVARKPDLLVVVEMKRHLSFDLLVQAVERQSYADAVYVAIPKPEALRLDKDWRAKLKVLRQLGLGLLLVGKVGQCYTVEEALSPGPARPARSSPRKRQAIEKEFVNRRLDMNVGGSSGVPLVTAYRESALYLAYLLGTHGPLTPASLRSLGAHPKRTTAILNANHYGWFAKAQDKCYALTEAGIEALTTYEPLISAFDETAKATQLNQEP
jgi:hypothetical protein